jgi:hypothetical protein
MSLFTQGWYDRVEARLAIAIARASAGGGGGGVSSVSGTPPITSTGGANPLIGITPATDIAAGSMSAADKLKLDGITPGAGVASVTASSPLASSGGANPNISLPGIVGVTHGGTGAAALANHGVLVGQGTAPVAVIGPGAANLPLLGGGGAADPAFAVMPLGSLAQSGATPGQVAQWNGAAWVPATSAGTGIFNVMASPYNAKGDGVTNDTAAIQAAEADCIAAGGGTVFFPRPPVSYLVTASGAGAPCVSVTGPNVHLLGAEGCDQADYPAITCGTYGATIFNVTADACTLENLSGQYGPTTKLNGAILAGVTSFVPVSTAGLNANDWLVMDQYPNLEQVQILSVVGPTVNLQTATQFAHADQSWVRDQSQLSGLVYGTPLRDVAALANFVTGNGCTVKNCGILAMVTGVKFRGDPTSNSGNNSNNAVEGLRTNFVQFGTLAQQQTNFRCKDHRYENATEGQTTAPGHGLYMTGLTGFAGAWAGGTTYAQYVQVSFGGVQYISRINGNLGNQPDISPADWSAQTFPTSGTGWRSRNYNLTITDITCIPGANFKDWSGVKVKFTLGGTVKGITIVGAVRGFDYQEFHNATTVGASMRDFIPPIALDSSAAAADVLNCDNHVFSSFSVMLWQAPAVGSIGGPIDMPVVLERVDGTVDPYTGIALGHDNVFNDIAATTNYSGAFTSAAFRAQGIRTHFGPGCYLNELGGNNPYAFYFSANGTAGTFANGGVLERPSVVGTTHVAQVSTGTTSGFWDIDNNLVPANAVYNDVNGVVVTNRFVTNVAGTQNYSPQSTANDVIGGTAPASAAFKWINFRDSTGNGQVAMSIASGLKTSLLSSDPTNGSYIGLGFNLTAGFPGSGQVLGGVGFTADNNSFSIVSAGYFAISAEAQGIAALGTDLVMQVIAPGTTTAVKAIRLFGTGDVLLNASGVANATSATAGFVYVPNMAGEPTGSLTGHANASAIQWDSTNGRLWVNTGSANWRDIAAQTVAASGPVTGSTFAAGSLQRLGSGQSGNSYVLTDPTKCKGSTITVVCTNAGGLYTFALTSAAGNINGAASYVFTSIFQRAAVTFESDGTDWQIASFAPTPYTQDSPALRGLVEWNGSPSACVGTGTVVSTTVMLQRLIALNGGLISNILASVGTLGSGFTAATNATITNVVNNGSGFCRVTAVLHTYSTNDVITQAGIVGAVEANTADVITVIDANTYDLNTTPFTSAYVSGGTATRSANCAAIYDSTGAFLTATGDQVAVWNSNGVKTMALAKQVTLTRGSVYYVALLFNGTASTLAFRIFGQALTANAGLAGATLLWSSNGTGTKLPASFAPGSNVQTNNLTNWVALS